MEKRLVDEDDNILRVKEDGTVILKLASEKRERNIGTFREGNYTKPLKFENRFHADNRVGFNEAVMRELNPEYIGINYGGRYLLITSEVFWAEKTYRHFKGQGFELQCFIPMEVFENRGNRQRVEVANDLKNKIKKPPLGERVNI